MPLPNPLTLAEREKVIRTLGFFADMPVELLPNIFVSMSTEAILNLRQTGNRKLENAATEYLLQREGDEQADDFQRKYIKDFSHDPDVLSADQKNFLMRNFLRILNKNRHFVGNFTLQLWVCLGMVGYVNDERLLCRLTINITRLIEILDIVQVGPFSKRKFLAYRLDDNTVSDMIKMLFTRQISIINTKVEAIVMNALSQLMKNETCRKIINQLILEHIEELTSKTDVYGVNSILQRLSRVFEFLPLPGQSLLISYIDVLLEIINQKEIVDASICNALSIAAQRLSYDSDSARILACIDVFIKLLDNKGFNMQVTACKALVNVLPAIPVDKEQEKIKACVTKLILMFGDESVDVSLAAYEAVGHVALHDLCDMEMIASDVGRQIAALRDSPIEMNKVNACKCLAKMHPVLSLDHHSKLIDDIVDGLFKTIMHPRIHSYGADIYPEAQRTFKDVLSKHLTVGNDKSKVIINKIIANIIAELDKSDIDEDRLWRVEELLLALQKMIFGDEYREYIDLIMRKIIPLIDRNAGARIVSCKVLDLLFKYASGKPSDDVGKCVDLLVKNLPVSRWGTVSNNVLDERGEMIAVLHHALSFLPEEQRAAKIREIFEILMRQIKGDSSGDHKAVDSHQKALKLSIFFLKDNQFYNRVIADLVAQLSNPEHMRASCNALVCLFNAIGDDGKISVDKASVEALITLLHNQDNNELRLAVCIVLKCLPRLNANTACLLEAVQPLLDLLFSAESDLEHLANLNYLLKYSVAFTLKMILQCLPSDHPEQRKVMHILIENKSELSRNLDSVVISLINDILKRMSKKEISENLDGVIKTIVNRSKEGRLSSHWLNNFDLNCLYLIIKKIKHDHAGFATIVDLLIRQVEVSSFRMDCMIAPLALIEVLPNLPRENENFNRIVKALISPKSDDGALFKIAMRAFRYLPKELAEDDIKALVTHFTNSMSSFPRKKNSRQMRIFYLCQLCIEHDLDPRELIDLIQKSIRPEKMGVFSALNELIHLAYNMLSGMDHKLQQSRKVYDPTMLPVS